MIGIVSASSSHQAIRRWVTAGSRRATLGRRMMSVRPEEVKQVKEGDAPPRKKITLGKLKQMRTSDTPIAMLTAYDFPTARACDAYGADIVLVGDSLAQVCLGYDSTTRLTMDEMLYHCRAVARGSRIPFLVADMPFGSFQARPEDAVRNAIRFVQEGGVEAVKMEGGEEILESIRRITSIGIPVMAHVGLLPQRHTASSGYRVQGKQASSADAILRTARSLQEAGAFSMVVEAVPAPLATYITQQLDIPTIGIGAGNGTSGQVLVWDDMVGTWNGHKAKFVRRFADVKAEQRRGVMEYVDAVRRRSFPDQSESYTMDESEWQGFLEMERQRQRAEGETPI